MPRPCTVARLVLFAAAVSSLHAAAQPSVPTQTIGPGEITSLARIADHLPHAAVSDPEVVRAFLEERIAPYIDFEAMARWAAGPYHERFSEAERRAFATKLRALFLRALARNLGGSARRASHVEIYPARFLRWGDEASVMARVTGSSPAPSVLMEFRFHRRPDGWKIFDAAANGFSAVSFFRGYFASLARQRGADALHR